MPRREKASEQRAVLLYMSAWENSTQNAWERKRQAVAAARTGPGKGSRPCAVAGAVLEVELELAVDDAHGHVVFHATQRHRGAGGRPVLARHRLAPWREF